MAVHVAVGWFVFAAAGCGLILDPSPLPNADGRDAGIDARDQEAGADAQPDGGPSSDAGPDVFSCTRVVEMCNGIDDDCDGIVDEDFDLATDPSNCGACGAPCTSSGVVATCVAGACQVDCIEGRADCDGDSSNGCEVNLSDPTHCGSCSNDCAGLLCRDDGSGFVCTDDCTSGETDCSGSCVDLATDLANCGSCGSACSAPSGTTDCVTGSCEIVSCPAGWDDCNETIADGCEASLSSNLNCGTCGNACSSTDRCMDGACVVVSCDDPTSWGFEVMPPLLCYGSCGVATIYCRLAGCFCEPSPGTAIPCDASVSSCEEAVTTGCCP